MPLLIKILATTVVFLAAAYVAGLFVRKDIRTSVTINASPEVVWSVLADTDAYPDWNPLVRKIDGDLIQGQAIRTQIQLGERAPTGFKPRLLVVEPGKELRWLGSTGLPRLFDGEHAFVLEPQADGTTLFRHEETFRGVLVLILMPLIGKDTQDGFQAMNDALKARAEAMAGD